MPCVCRAPLPHCCSQHGLTGQSLPLCSPPRGHLQEPAMKHSNAMSSKYMYISIIKVSKLEHTVLVIIIACQTLHVLQCGGFVTENTVWWGHKSTWGSLTAQNFYLLLSHWIVTCWLSSKSVEFIFRAFDHKTSYKYLNIHRLTKYTSTVYIMCWGGSLLIDQNIPMMSFSSLLENRKQQKIILPCSLFICEDEDGT